MHTGNDSNLEKLREKARAYRAVFSSEQGKQVLLDLEAAFGFRQPSARAGMRNEEVWLAEGMKLPFYHIERLLRATPPTQKPVPARR